MRWLLNNPKIWNIQQNFLGKVEWSIFLRIYCIKKYFFKMCLTFLQISNNFKPFRVIMFRQVIKWKTSNAWRKNKLLLHQIGENDEASLVCSRGLYYYFLSTSWPGNFSKVNKWHSGARYVKNKFEKSTNSKPSSIISYLKRGNFSIIYRNWQNIKYLHTPLAPLGESLPTHAV